MLLYTGPSELGPAPKAQAELGGAARPRGATETVAAWSLVTPHFAGGQSERTQRTQPASSAGREGLRSPARAPRIPSTPPTEAVSGSQSRLQPRDTAGAEEGGRVEKDLAFEILAAKQKFDTDPLSTPSNPGFGRGNGCPGLSVPGRVPGSATAAGGSTATSARFSPRPAGGGIS